MVETPHIEVMILGYNCKEDVLACLNSVVDIEYDSYSITYLDNASGDGTADAVRNEFPQVQVVEYKENYGFPEGYDRAIERTDAPYVALLNPDTFVPPDWLSNYAREIRVGDEDIVAWGGRIDILGSDKVHFAGGKITPMGSGIEPDVWKKQEEVKDCHRKWTALGCGANMVVDTEKFEEIGGFDRDFFMYFEDVDFGWRAWLQGYKIRYIPEARIEHRFGGVVGSQSPFESELRTYYGVRNRKWTLLKNGSRLRVLYGLPLSLVYDCVLLTQALFKRQWSIAWKIFQANGNALKSLPALIQKRRTVQAAREKTEGELAEYGIFAGLRESIRFFKRLRNTV